MRAAGRGTVLFVLLLILRGSTTTADDLGKAQSTLASLRADLQSGRIVRADIFSISYYRSSIARVTPDLLEVHPGNNKRSVELSVESITQLMKAIDDTQVSLYSGGIDLKWGAVFFDKSGTRLQSIYLDGWYASLGAGRGGTIGGVDVSLNGALIVWFETNFDTR